MAQSVIHSSMVQLSFSAAEGERESDATSWQMIPFAMEFQFQEQWCWAAVTRSVSLFFDASTSWTQCELVNDQFGLSTCCVDGSSNACDQPWYLERALDRTGNLADVIEGAVRREDIQSEIQAMRPVGVRIGWDTGGGHFVIIDGFSGSDMLHVQDPLYDEKAIDYDTLRTAYRGNGSWTHSYQTKG